MKNQLIIFILLFLTTNLSFSQIDFVEIENRADWENILENAERDGKLVFLDIYATWCGPCKYLDNNVYPDKELGIIYNAQYVNAKIDGESDFGRTLVSKFGLTAYPTMYYLTDDQEVITKIVGVREAGPLGEIGETIAKNTQELKKYASKYENDELNTSELIAYQKLLMEIGQEQKATEIAGNIVPGLSKEDIMKPDYKEMIINSPVDLDSKVYAVLTENTDNLTDSWGAEDVDALFTNIYNNSLRKAIRNKDENLLNNIVNDFLPLYIGENPDELKNGVYETNKLYYANTNNWDKYDSFVRNQYEEMAPKNDKFFYNEAYEIANEYNRNQEALNLATDFMETALEIDESVDNLVLMSFLNGMKGNYETARDYIAQAENMQLNEEQKALVDELKRLIQQAEQGSN